MSAKILRWKKSLGEKYCEIKAKLIAFYQILVSFENLALIYRNK